MHKINDEITPNSFCKTNYQEHDSIFISQFQAKDCKKKNNNSEKINVLHIANYQASYRGNFISSLENLTKSLSYYNISSIYMFPEQGEFGVARGWMDELKDEGRTVYELKESLFYNAKIIRKIVQRHEIAIIHTHFISMKQFLPVLFASLFSKTKIVMHFHNHSIEAYGLKKAIRRFLYSKCVMVACSQSVYDNLCRDYPTNKKYMVNNGIEYKRFESNTIANRFEYGIKDDSIVCLIFGFDFYRKGVDLALKALENLNKNETKYELLISLSKNLQYVEDEIKKILGIIPNWVHVIKARSDVEALYNMSDLFLSPSREEGLPYSVLEAGYCSCMVVTSDIPAQAKLNIPYVLLHENENYNSLKDAILEAVEQKKEKADNIYRVRKFLKQNYSVTNWVESIKNIYFLELD